MAAHPCKASELLQKLAGAEKRRARAGFLGCQLRHAYPASTRIPNLFDCTVCSLCLQGRRDRTRFPTISCGMYISIVLNKLAVYSFCCSPAGAAWSWRTRKAWPQSPSRPSAAACTPSRTPVQPRFVSNGCSQVFASPRSCPARVEFFHVLVLYVTAGPAYSNTVATCFVRHPA